MKIGYKKKNLLVKLWEKHGLAKGENRLAKLMSELMAAHRSQDIPLALNDAAARQKLYQEFHIK